MNFNIIGRSSSFKKVVTTRDLSIAYVACYVIPLDSTAPDPALPPSSLTACLLSLSSVTQTGLKKFLEYVQLGTSDKVARLLDKGLDPNYHDSDSGGRERAAGRGALGGLGSQGRRGPGAAHDRPFPRLPETPLTLAAQTEGSVEVIRTLCLGGAHIDFRARDGMTALHKAACARHCLALTVRFQILLGPSPEPRDSRVTVFFTQTAFGQSPRPLRPPPPSTVTPLAAPKTLLGPMGAPSLPSSRLVISYGRWSRGPLPCPQVDHANFLISRTSPALLSQQSTPTSVCPRCRLFLVPFIFIFLAARHSM